MNYDKVVICAIAKYEYEYIKEWVEYHLKLGFDKIYIYDNNDANGETYDELLANYINDGKVEIRNVRGLDKQQRPVYNNFYKNDDFDWVAFIDIDEYISPNRTKFKSIKDILKQNENADAYWLFWQCFGDSGNIKSNNTQSILKRYNKPIPFWSLIDNAIAIQNRWGKSIIRKGLPITYLHEHFIVNCETPVNYCDVFGNPVSPYVIVINEQYKKYIETTYKQCYIKHFYTKSLEDYIEHKTARFAANSGYVLHTPTRYFRVNDITQEKVEYLKNIGFSCEILFKPDTLFVVELKNPEQYKKLEPYINNILARTNVRGLLKLIENPTNENFEGFGSQLNDSICYVNNYGKDLELLYNCFSGLYDVFYHHCKLLIHIGLPEDGEITDEYIQHYIEPLFGENLINNMKSIMLRKDSTILCHKDSMCENKPIFDNDEQLAQISSKFVSEYDFKYLPNYYISNNTFIAKLDDIYKTTKDKKFNFNIDEYYQMLQKTFTTFFKTIMWIS